MQNKPYITDEAAPLVVSEPAAAYLSAAAAPPVEWRSDIAVPPCRMTLAELKAEVRQSVADAQTGSGITLAEARARHPRL